ncbi:hypothetical protein Nocox_03530 [Nonomuraea coxensis DSM 45129]|uniref:Uncharacterized protein n=1 Tax=Nonomuraea coxensis DSM 45129 TaxID=1122611 RepID=A0ABX8TS89_9ACTN|nr:hypothetical protein [Nonomuraea coxensis]QYC38335.1 hypothetical protein Nocox_03530 [Nonomuraea coxensis DSM 45129]
MSTNERDWFSPEQQPQPPQQGWVPAPEGYTGQHARPPGPRHAVPRPPSPPAGAPAPPSGWQGAPYDTRQARPPVRAPHPDQQVWPPAARQQGSSTQPIPVVPGAPAARPWPPQGLPPQPAPTGQHAGQHAAGAGKPRRRLLVAGAAVAVSLLTVAVNLYDTHAFYEQQITRGMNHIETVVPAGQPGKAYDTEWRVAVAPTKPPEGNKHGPDVTWMKVDITKRVVDAAAATMIAEPNNVKFTDRAGREWTVPIEPVGDRPLERLEVGRDYRIQGLAIVPTAVADEVELSFEPSNYRSDTPTEDLFDREKMEALGVDVYVLRFRRR